MQEQMRKQQQAQQRMPDGHVSIEPDPAKQRRSRGDDGDYVDYEEIK